MSNIVLMTRLASAAAADMMMHTSSSSISMRRNHHYAPLILSSFGNLSINNNISAAITTNNKRVYFSSVASSKKKHNIVELPPNLKFDPRATSSPFYGADEVVQTSRRKQSLGQETAATAATDDDDATAKEIDDDDEEYSGVDDDDYDDEAEEERVLYDLSTKADVPRAIPLPQRLHVPIMDFKSGEEVGTFHLSNKTFGCDPVRVDILQRVVVWQRNKKRGKRNAGARTKTISEVSGSGKKVRNQKGGGVARAGHSRPAHWRGGAKAHGPKGNIQDYTTKLNKKVRRMGMRHALSQKLLEGNLIITNDMAATTHKTKVLDEMLNRFNVSGKYGVTALMVDDAQANTEEGSSEDNNEAFVYGGVNVNLKVASGNLHKVKVQNQIACNVYDMLKYKKLFLSLDAVRALEARLEK
jgi:large subunit ribosomal protein L4